MSTEAVRDEILQMESAALERWCDGDPSGFLEICSDDVTYFDPYLGERIDGLAALRDYYESLRGKVFASSFEMVAPVVQCYGDVAVLTFRFNSRGREEEESRWNCTEVYRRIDGRWRIVQTHWSLTEAGCALAKA